MSKSIHLDTVVVGLNTERTELNDKLFVRVGGVLSPTQPKDGDRLIQFVKYYRPSWALRSKVGTANVGDRLRIVGRMMEVAGNPAIQISQVHRIA